MTEEGNLISSKDDDDFNQFITSADLDGTLEAGNYIIFVNTLWNESASFEEEYKDVVVGVYCTETVRIETVDAEAGFRTLC